MTPRTVLSKCRCPMYALCLGWMLVGHSGSVLAQSTGLPSSTTEDSSQLPPAPPDMRATFCEKPPVAPMLAAYARSPLFGDAVQVRVRIAYRADGTVTSARMDPGSGDEDFNEAIVRWAKRIRVCPGVAGEGRVPLSFW